MAKTTTAQRLIDQARSNGVLDFATGAGTGNTLTN